MIRDGFSAPDYLVFSHSLPYHLLLDKQNKGVLLVVLGHRTGFIHSDIRIGNLIVYNGNVYVIDYSSAIPVNILNHYQGCLSTASNNILKILDVNNSMSQANEKIQLHYADDGMSYLKMILLLKEFFQKYSLLIKQAIADGMTCHILSTYEYAMDVLHEKNIVKTIRYLEKHRETLSMNDLNWIMIHTLRNENQIDYDINEHLDRLSLS